MAVKSLLEIVQSILLAHSAAITDIGDMPYRLARPVLHEMKSTQLKLVETNSRSPIHPDTEEIWERLCCAEFVKIRILVEDRKEVILPPSGFWRDLYLAEEIKAIQKLESLRTKMRSQAADHLAAKRTVIAVDAIQVNKRKKLNSSTFKPKTLMEKARAKSKEVSRIYAPRRKSLDVVPISTLKRPLPTASSNTNSSMHAFTGPIKPSTTTTRVVVRTIKSLPTTQRSSSIPPSFRSSIPTPPPAKSKPSPLAHSTTTTSEQILNSRTSTSLPPSSPRPASATQVKRPSTSLFMPKKSKIVPRR